MKCIGQLFTLFILAFTAYWHAFYAFIKIKPNNVTRLIYLRALISQGVKSICSSIGKEKFPHSNASERVSSLPTGCERISNAKSALFCTCHLFICVSSRHFSCARRENPSSLSGSAARTSDQWAKCVQLIPSNHFASPSAHKAAHIRRANGSELESHRPLFTCLIRGIVSRVRTMCHHFPRCGEKLQMRKTERVGRASACRRD
jgi:hypothetical protein